MGGKAFRAEARFVEEYTTVQAAVREETAPFSIPVLLAQMAGLVVVLRLPGRREAERGRSEAKKRRTPPRGPYG